MTGDFKLEEPEERVNHPRWYTSHPSGIECIDLIEHLPTNLGNATKYVWRYGLKTTETPLRDLKSARWYVERERARIELYELDHVPLTTDIVWRSLARRVIEKDEGLLRVFLLNLLDGSTWNMLEMINQSIRELEAPP